MLAKRKKALRIPGVDLLARLGVKPNHLTLLGLIIGVTAVFQEFTTGIILFSVAFLLDLLDGNLARRHELTTHFGGVLDSVIDKLVEVLFIYYLAVKFSVQTMGMLSIGLSILISYVKHRADLKIHSFFDRAERLIYLLLVALFLSDLNQFILAFNVYNLLCLGAITQLMVKSYES